MHMLADTVELVIGVDTHKHTHTAAVVVAATGTVLEQVNVPAAPAGYQQLLKLARRQPGRRVWAIEGTGGYGAGLTRFLQAQAEQVVELDRPKRAARRHGAKSDSLDAIRAAREALGRDQLAQPRAAGHRAALSVRLAARRSAVQATTDAQRQLHALVVAAPDTLRSGCVISPHLAWSAPAGGYGYRPPGMSRPSRPRPACAPWLVASSSWTPRLPTTPEPSPPSYKPGTLSCSRRLGWARSWLPSCSVLGPIRAAAQATPPSPCWAALRRSPPPPARRSGCG